ncbi:hypothetical protein EROM_061380 [Encephalitozoon romaleae SJ-2008]|uniref:CDT1 Geminin-binding domain-containing protein n=1 Tax=Encephalitozoon romaleae (strain SJ-2008) TaxID=1178016 RepID=I7ANA4_ENCRO|nr:hypothetical protein EROM_061380 [Encephalitozoon romaleae SJ-2008]AFN83229.1 hypothetical protein EROM_061380 [Encephalitozoon romaleae SJ-2008]
MGEHEIRRKRLLRRKKEVSRESIKAGGCKMEKEQDHGKVVLIGRWLEKLKELGLNGEENVITRKKDADEEARVSEKDREETTEDKGGLNEERKEKIRQFGGVSHLEFKGLSLNFHLYLPKSLQKLSRIFRVLETIQRFNSARNLTTIFIKSLGCIENLVKQRVVVGDIERMYYIAPDLFRFKKISIHHDGKEVDTFVIYVSGETKEFNERLEEYVKKCHLEFLNENGYVYNGNRFHPEFNFEEVPLPRKPLFPEDIKEETIEKEVCVPTKRNVDIVESAKKRASTILERIREKERLRREEFMNKSKEEEDNVLLSNRIKMLLRSENRRAIPVNKVVDLLKIFDGVNTINRIIKWDSSLFYIRNMRGVEYLVSKE